MSDYCWRATHSDLDTLVTLAKEFHAISPFAKYNFSPSGSRQYFQLMMRCPNSIILMHDDGLIGGTVSNYPFCDLRLGKESFWYARRHGLGGMVLLKDYMKWVESKGGQIDLLSSLEIKGRTPGVINRALQMSGFHIIERTHMRVI